ncbi:hypothetical protein GFGA_1d0981 [Gluconobacter frateurii NBRC 103465]|nr:hypothetical protein GFGA_1d0981 [Gluconobacter frateurii NBRC 103465]
MAMADFSNFPDLPFTICMQEAYREWLGYLRHSTFIRADTDRCASQRCSSMTHGLYSVMGIEKQLNLQPVEAAYAPSQKIPF